MITEDYVSFETAKLLKEKGFDGECRDCYNIDAHFYSEDFKSNWNHLGLGTITVFSAPTLQMAMKWLREVHKIHISVVMGFDVDNHQYYFFVPSVCRFLNKSGEYGTPFGEKEFNTYEEACEEAIKYCLEKLLVHKEEKWG